MHSIMTYLPREITPAIINALPSFDNYSLMTISDSEGTLLPGFLPDHCHNAALIPK
jgi:hypothetical protein